MVLKPSFMAEIPEPTPEKNRTKTALLSVLAAATLAATATGLKATASENGPDPAQAERVVKREAIPEPIAVTAAVAEIKIRTMSECRVLADRAEKRACMLAVKEARNTELAKLDSNIETEQDANEKRHTRNDVLISQIAERAQQEPSP